MKIDIRSMNIAQLTELLTELGQPKFRAAQLFKWLQSGVETFDEMTNIPKNLREALAEKCYIANVEIERKFVSLIDGTVKYVYRLFDGEYIESVLMSYNHGYTVCISTQVGCRMGCSFCASGLNGKVRDLTASEMLAQIKMAEKDNGIRVSNVVMMGMGEPFDNYDNVLRFLQLVSHPDGMNIGMRHISLSTCGLVPKIDALAQEKLQLTLSVSLHAPNDRIRDTIMPVNKAYPTEELIGACRRYYEATGRRISFEYAMIDGVNDSVENAQELLHRMKGLPAHFNLIPLNHVEESPLKPSSKAAVAKFQKILEDGGITATVRRTLGGDIDASCGQLRRKYNKESK